MSMKVTRCQFVHGLPCEQVAERISRLESENAKPREEIEAAKHALSMFSGRIVELGTENANLRELVHDAVSLLDETCDTYYEIDYHSIVGRARELGIEVDK